MTESGSVDQTRGGRAAGTDVVVEEVAGVDDELVAAFAGLLPQLSSSTPPPGPGELAALVASPAITLLVARAGPDGAGGQGPIVGTLTLAVFPIPTGVRAWIEDVVVDQGARGMGVGEALTAGALERARARGARTVDLTSRPSREAANRLYQRLGFVLRETNLYRLDLG